MTNSPRRALVDTNILVCAYSSDSSEYTACRELVERGGTDSCEIYVCPQVLMEFLVAVTNAKRVQNARTLPEALALVEELSRLLPIIQPPPDLHLRVAALLATGQFGRTQTYDLMIATTAISNGFASIFSYDQVFSRIPGITVIVP